MPETQKTKPFQRILILLSGLVFLGSSAFAMVGLFTRSPNPSAQQNSGDNQAKITQLKQQEKGYQTVLAREPNNVAALQGLAQSRIELEDFKGAQEPLEALVKLYPKDPNLKALLDLVKQRANAPTAKPSK